MDIVADFNKTVVEHLESGTLLHEINGYGIIQPSYTEYYHEKFRHFVIGDYNKGVKEEEKVTNLPKNRSKFFRQLCWLEKVV